MHKEDVRVLQILQRGPPVDLPALLREQDLRRVVEEFRRDIFLDRGGLPSPYPGEHESFESTRREAARGVAGPVAELRVRALAQERDGRPGLVKRETVIRARERSREQALAVA